MSDEVRVDLRRRDPEPGEPCPSCGSSHRTWRTLAKCLYPRAGGIYDDDGGGPWLAVHQMRQPNERADCPNLHLFPTQVQAKRWLDAEHPGGRACCGSCARSMRGGRQSLYIARVGARIFGASSFKVWGVSR